MKTLQYGSSGPMVEYLQLGLRRAGYDPGTIDGIFGARTLRALEQFQRDSGLTADGVAGRLTWAQLFPYLAGYTVYVLQAGDTLEKIADGYDTTRAALITANPGVELGELTAEREIIVPLGFDVVPDNVRYTHLLTGIVLDGLASRYPFLRRETIGKSVMGKSLYAVSMGVGEKSVFYNAAHHANEWITTPVLLRYLETYAKAYATGGSVYDAPAKTLYEKTALFLAPLVNPDGVDLVTGMIPADDSYYLQAQALSTFYPTIPFPSGWKANIAGIDPNLSYPANWEVAKRIKYAQGYTRPGPRDFVGTAPLSSPEAKSVYDFTLAHDFLLTLSYHTQGNVIYWKYLNYEPEGAPEIGKAFAAASGYALEETPYASGFAGYKDWFIQTYVRPGYTIECGQGVSPLPMSQFAEIFADNLGILTLGMAMV